VELLRVFLLDAGYAAFDAEEVERLIAQADPERTGLVRFGQLRSLACFAIAEHGAQEAEDVDHDDTAPDNVPKVLYAAVPEGVAGGDVLLIEADGGHVYKVKMPAGLSPGDVFAYETKSKVSSWRQRLVAQAEKGWAKLFARIKSVAL